jgi:hypothetical protein
LTPFFMGVETALYHCREWSGLEYLEQRVAGSLSRMRGASSSPLVLLTWSVPDSRWHDQLGQTSRHGVDPHTSQPLLDQVAMLSNQLLSSWAPSGWCSSCAQMSRRRPLRGDSLAAYRQTSFFRTCDSLPYKDLTLCCSVQSPDRKTVVLSGLRHFL